MSPSPAASLHTGLLASKGNAQPSRGLAQPLSEGVAAGRLDAGSLIRNLAPANPPVANAAAQNRITVRVDEKQRLRLRLASAHLGKSRQVILLDALEHYLHQVLPTFLHDHCPCIDGGEIIESDRCLQVKK